MKFEIDESDRQMIILALAVLSLQRPGYEYYNGEIAEKFSGREMFGKLREYNQDITISWQERRIIELQDDNRALHAKIRRMAGLREPRQDGL